MKAYFPETATMGESELQSQDWALHEPQWGIPTLEFSYAHMGTSSTRGNISTEQFLVLHEWTGERPMNDVLDMVKEYDVIERVYMHRDEEWLTCLMIISATTAEAEMRIYDMIQAIVSGSADILIDFEVINLADLPEGVSIEHKIPENASLVMERRLVQMVMVQGVGYSAPVNRPGSNVATQQTGDPFDVTGESGYRSSSPSLN